MHNPKPVSCYGNIAEGSPSKAIDKSMKEVDTNTKYKPGQPTSTDVGFDYITLQWGAPEAFMDDVHFQISYRELEDSEWNNYSKKCKDSLQTVTNLKPETNYLFRVRVIHKDWEGPYSAVSGSIKTVESAASKLVKSASCKSISGTLPKQYTLTMEQKERNRTAKIRALELGSQQNRYVAEKTIMMVGETGTGKSTMIDGMANYILGVRWEDKFRLKMVNLESEEKVNSISQAQSQTEWVTCYTVHPIGSGRLKYSIHIIDTPGFGDTRGIEQDKKIVEQIYTLFKSPPPAGVLIIDAICFLVKAPDCRLTTTQKYIFDQIMSIFGKDIEGNICTLITFADGNEPLVLSALNQSGLPFGQNFMFNNSALYTNNTNIVSANVSRMFWEMGADSFQTFFRFVESLHTKSLQLTKDVLFERSRLENNLSNLELTIDAAICKKQELTSEIDSLEKYKEIIKTNKNYTMKTTQCVKKIKSLTSGEYVTICTFCQYTCHPKCKRKENSDKKGCWAMGKDGYCRICPNTCIWKKHVNAPYQYVLVVEKVVQTFAEMKKKIDEATGKALNQEQVLQIKKDEYLALNTQMEEMMNNVISCKRRLAVIALRPNPLSDEGYINQMIVNEQKEQRPGCDDRIKVLNGLKKKAKVPERYQTLREQEAVEEKKCW